MNEREKAISITDRNSFVLFIFPSSKGDFRIEKKARREIACNAKMRWKAALKSAPKSRNVIKQKPASERALRCFNSTAEINFSGNKLFPK